MTLMAMVSVGRCDRALAVFAIMSIHNGGGRKAK
jgi:hypothetical protein